MYIYIYYNIYIWKCLHGKMRVTWSFIPSLALKLKRGRRHAMGGNRACTVLSCRLCRRVGAPRWTLLGGSWLVEDPWWGVLL